MNVFVPYKEPLEVAKVLDGRRRNKQILECDWIVRAVDARKNGTKAYSMNHPIVKMYEDHLEWLDLYKRCLKAYRDDNGSELAAYIFSEQANLIAPEFLTQEYLDNMKSRLYTKDPNFYKVFESYGTSDHNWYYLDGKFVVY